MANTKTALAPQLAGLPRATYNEGDAPDPRRRRGGVAGSHPLATFLDGLGEGYPAPWVEQDMVQAPWPHPWLRPDLGQWPRQVAEAQALQRQLASHISIQPFAAEVKLVAGADVSSRRGQDKAKAAVVVLRFPELAVVEVAVAEGKLALPYIPGLLSFREAPLVLEAFAQLKSRPQLLLVDGQGLAHPRRFGLACHLGLLLDLPTIGCAKSRLWGHSQEVGPQPGQWAPLMDGEETIGAALRTREGVKPVYVSVGHRIDLQSACAWVRRLCRGFRLPEPLRCAHRVASQGKMV